MTETIKGTAPLHKIRRQERAQDDAWIRQFLLAGAMGTMATAVEGQPFLVTRNYAYDSDRHAIYMHGARKGRTYENVCIHQQVCFSVSEMGRLLPATEALEMGVEYAGVVLFGKVAIVEDPAEAQHGLQLLLDKYFPHLKTGRDYAPITPEGLKITAVYRIDIESWSGKAEKAAPDHPGAFTFGAFPFED
jgi:nitroimidazol reductase NimA-like FMN-containing flavoprotein (pyridoxamine 5'-phosphate oxidase superfamily)